MRRKTFGGKMAAALRHKPEDFGIVLSPEGKISTEVFAKALKVTVERILEEVKADEKGRFIVKDGMIWAAQGHSIPVEVKLTRIFESDVLYHGTKQKFLESILEQGLVAKGRNFVHLSPSIEVAQIVADRRRGDSVLLVIDSQKMLSDGVEIFVSENGVYLSETVATKYITVL